MPVYYSIRNPISGRYRQMDAWVRELSEATKYESPDEAEKVCAFKGLAEMEIVTNTTPFVTRKPVKDVA